MDQDTGYKELKFYCIKIDFAEPTCKKCRLVMYIRHDYALVINVLIKIANDLQWKLDITMEYTGKGMSHRNQLAKLGFADIAGKARAMMVQANLHKEIKYKLCKECLNSEVYLSNLAVVTLNGKTTTRHDHILEAKPCYAMHLRICREAGTVSMGKNGKVRNIVSPMIFIGYEILCWR